MGVEVHTVKVTELLQKPYDDFSANAKGQKTVPSCGQCQNRNYKRKEMILNDF